WMQNCWMADRNILGRNTRYTSGTTGRRIEDASNMRVHKCRAGHLGGEQQLGALIEQNGMELVICLIERLAHQTRDQDVTRKFEWCKTRNIPLSTDLSTAVMMYGSLGRGEMDWREMYK